MLVILCFYFLLLFVASRQHPEPQDAEIRSLSPPESGIDVVVLQPTNELLAHLVLFLPWVQRFHIFEMTEFAHLPNAMTSLSRFVIFKRPFQDYCLFAPNLAAHFLLVETWKPTQFFFASDFFHLGKPIFRQETNVVPFTRTGYNQGFHFVEQAREQHDFRNCAMTRMQMNHACVFARTKLLNASAIPDLVSISAAFAPQPEWRIVILGDADDRELSFFNSTIWVQFHPLPMKEKLSFLKRVVARKGMAVECHMPKPKTSKDLELVSVFIVQSVRALIGVQNVQVFGTCTIARRVASVFNTHAKPFLKDSSEALKLIQQL